MTDPWRFSDFPLDIEDAEVNTSTLDSQGQATLPVFDQQSSLKFPDLDSFQYGPLEEISSKSESIASETSLLRDIDASEIDVWAAVPFEQYDASAKTRTWEQVGGENIQEPNLYLSEATIEVWNSLWAKIDARSDIEVVVPIRHDHVVRCLIDLGTGLNSDLFTFDAAGHASFRDGFTFSGLSLELSMSIMQTVGQCGESFRATEQLVNVKHFPNDLPRPMIAIASAVSEILGFVRQHLSERSSSVFTILQVQELYRRPYTLLAKLLGLLRDAREFKDENSIINKLFHLAREHEFSEQWFYNIVLHLLHLSSQALLEDVSNLVGLHVSKNTTNYRFRMLENSLQNHESAQGSNTTIRRLPEIFDSTQECMVVNIHQSLNLLRNQQPNHLLMDPIGPVQGRNFRLELVLGWKGIDGLQSQAAGYEQLLHQRLNQDENIVSSSAQDSGHGCSFNVAPDPYSMDVTIFERDNAFAVRRPRETAGYHEFIDHLRSAVLSALRLGLTVDFESERQVPITVLAKKSFAPLLSIQSREVNRACLVMLFKDCDLLHHFDILYLYNLLGSGIFATKLKQALFSPDLSSAERRKGQYRSGQHGLRLGSRSTWPPASAELRLALMGIMADCYAETFPTATKQPSNDLPGGIAFSIRNLTEPEIQACMNPASLQAMDFLRIQYQPDNALAGIFHEEALGKYDLILKFLLRLSRVSFEVDQLSIRQRKAGFQGNFLQHRYLLEARHFVHTLVAYVYSRVAAIWSRFKSMMISMKDDLDHNYGVTASQHSDGILRITALHDLMLGEIMFDLLLSRRHEKAMQLLERVLSGILRNALTTKSHAEALKCFRADASSFLIICQDLSERSDQMHEEEEEAALSDNIRRTWKTGASSGPSLKTLLLCLDMNGWYSKQITK